MVGELKISNVAQSLAGTTILSFTFTGITGKLIICIICMLFCVCFCNFLMAYYLTGFSLTLSVNLQPASSGSVGVSDGGRRTNASLFGGLSAREKKRLVAQYGDLSNDEDDDEYPFHNVIIAFEYVFRPRTWCEILCVHSRVFPDCCLLVT